MAELEGIAEARAVVPHQRGEHGGDGGAEEREAVEQRGARGVGLPRGAVRFDQEEREGEAEGRARGEAEGEGQAREEGCAASERAIDVGGGERGADDVRDEPHGALDRGEPVDRSEGEEQREQRVLGQRAAAALAARELVQGEEEQRGATPPNQPKKRPSATRSAEPASLTRGAMSTAGKGES